MRSVRFPPFGFVMKEIWSTLIYRMQFLHKDIFGKMWCMTICSKEELNGMVWFQCRLLIITFVTNFFIRGEVVFFSSRISVNYGHKLRLVAKKIKRNYIRKLRYLWWELVLVRAECDLIDFASRFPPRQLEASRLRGIKDYRHNLSLIYMDFG